MFISLARERVTAPERGPLTSHWRPPRRDETRREETRRNQRREEKRREERAQSGERREEREEIRAGRGGRGGAGREGKTPRHAGDRKKAEWPRRSRK
jgi:hypothetical protein